MTVIRLLRLAKELSPSTFSEDTLLMWISQVENILASDVAQVPPEELTEITEPTNAQMLVPHPFDRVYLPYVQAQIAYAQGETDLYQNYLALYNAYRDEWMAWVRNGKWRRSEWYLSAYNIAVEHGYTGTVDEWLASLKGDKGEKGDGVVILGHYDTLDLLETDHPEGKAGDYYEVGTAADNAVVYYWAQNLEEWTPIDIVDGQRKAREAAQQADMSRTTAQQYAGSAERNAQNASVAAQAAIEHAGAARDYASAAQDAEYRANAAAQATEGIRHEVEQIDGRVTQLERNSVFMTANVTSDYEAAVDEGRCTSPVSFIVGLPRGKYFVEDGGSECWGITTEVGGTRYTEVTQYEDDGIVYKYIYINGKKCGEWGTIDSDSWVGFPGRIIEQVEDLGKRMSAVEAIQHPESWDDVQKIVRAGLARKYFEIGDQLQCQRAGETLTWDIIGIGQDTPADSKLEHSMTLQLHDGLVTKDGAQAKRSWAFDTNGSNDWAGSSLRNWLNSSEPMDAAYAMPGFLHGCDEDFLAAIGAVVKMSRTASGAVQRTDDVVFIPSKTEVNGKGNDGDDGRNEDGTAVVHTAYEMYKAADRSDDPNETRAKRFLNSSGVMANAVWALRTPALSGSTSVRFVSGTGAIAGTNSATTSLQQLPCVCIV